MLTFFAFGALIVTTGYHSDVALLIAFIAFALFIARPVAIFLLVHSRGPSPAAPDVHRLVRAEGGGGHAVRRPRAQLRGRRRATRSSRAAAFVILASILIHGATDTLGTKWIERRIEADEDSVRRPIQGSRRAAARCLGAEDLLLLLAELGRGQHALLLQFAELLQPIELRVVRMLRRPRRARGSPSPFAGPPPPPPSARAGASRPPSRPAWRPGTRAACLRLSASMPAPASPISSSARTSWRVPVGRPDDQRRAARPPRRRTRRLPGARAGVGASAWRMLTAPFCGEARIRGDHEEDPEDDHAGGDAVEQRGADRPRRARAGTRASSVFASESTNRPLGDGSHARSPPSPAAIRPRP